MSFANSLLVSLLPLSWVSNSVTSPPVSSQVVKDASATSTAVGPVPTYCGDIIDQVNQEYYFFDAKDVYQCLVSVPFIDAVATRFVDYYNTSLQFQSTLAYLRDPPQAYQQPPIDVMNALEVIQQNITAGHYKNQYEFEATLQSLVYGMHDGHVDLTAGILSAFSFGALYDIMSISIDGKQPPQPYIALDVISSQAEGWTPSPIVSLNGEDAVKFLTRFAELNSVGTLEAHADWNQLMYSPAQDIEGIYNTFGWEATFYPGENLTYVLANGTVLNTSWLAIYRAGTANLTGPLTTGGDFYNYFVLGFLPASFVPPGNDTSASDNAATNTSLPSWNSVNSAYPNNPDIVQPDLSVEGGGYLTGYFLNDTSTAVLSIPSFNQYGDQVGSFSNTTRDFIVAAKSINISRVVIDLQQNYGGQALLAIDTFKQFFPPQVPFAGSRRRSHQLANILGEAMTGFWSSLEPGDAEGLYDYYYPTLAADEWVVTDRINALTGQNFSSWQEYYGPLRYQNDEFSLIEQYNLSSVLFDIAAFDGYAPAYTGTAPEDLPSPWWDAKDIVLLTDGVCSSACALFVELMTHQAGVRTVVVGGRPETGPMQTASGTRGAYAYSASELDSDLAFAGLVSETANVSLPQVRDPGMWTSYAGINLRDQIRKNDTIPLQFHYEAANCRIYYTLANAFNMSRLWRDAARATWDDPSLCVQGSTGYSAYVDGATAKAPPAYKSPDADFQAIESASIIDFDYEYLGGLPDGVGVRVSGEIEACTASCPNGCKTIICPDKVTKGSACLPPCQGNQSPCANGGLCQPQKKSESKTRSTGGTSSKNAVRNGICFPVSVVGLFGCADSTGKFGAPS